MSGDMIAVAIVGMGCFTGIAITGMNLFAGRFRERARPRLEAEVAALRKEIGELKAISSDMVLSLDSTLQHQSALLQTMEKRAISDGTLPRYQGIAAGAAGSAAEPDHAEREPRELRSGV
jgi:hypothetical protein